MRSVEDRCADALPHGGPAAFLTEPILGNRGGVVPPPGYLEAAFSAVRRHGGLCIADEVQVGFARTGATFWAFQNLGAVPDLVAGAKAAGNGHPLGFVACQGIDLVEGRSADTTTLRPERVAGICERLLELGVIVQPTGLLGNVLKIKPPLCIGLEDAERYLSCLDRALTEHEELIDLVAATDTLRSPRA